MAAKKKSTKKAKAPHCTVLKDKKTGLPKKTSAGKNMKMCWKDGKLVSETVVKQHRARQKAKKAS